MKIDIFHKHRTGTWEILADQIYQYEQRILDHELEKANQGMQG